MPVCAISLRFFCLGQIVKPSFNMAFFSVERTVEEADSSISSIDFLDQTFEGKATDS